MPLQRSTAYPILLLVLASVFACDGDPGDPRVVASVEPLTPSPISASAGASVSLAVHVKDNRGDPMPGVAVKWTVVSGGGTISGGASGQDGRAEAVWVLGIQAGEQRAQATVDGAGSVLFTADAEPLDVPVIASIEPPLLRPGNAATITGGGFAGTPGGNVVTVAGVAAVVTAASPTELTITVPTRDRLPCLPTQPVPVTVTVAGVSGSRDHPLQVATQRSLAPGESLLLLDADEVRCNELADGGARYVIGVVNTSSVLSSTSAFRLRGASAATTAAEYAPAIADAAAPAPPSRAAAATAAPQASPRLLASGPQDELHRALRERAAAHERMLAQNLDLLRRLGPRRTVRGAAGATGSAAIAATLAAAPPPNVGDTIRFRVPNIDSSNLCSNFTEVVGRVVYSGARAVILEDRNAPLAGRIDSLYVKLGEEYDNTIHSIITQYFGDPLKLDAQTDDNGRIYMLFTKLVNDFDGNVFAFVFSGDLFPRVQCNQSNVAEIFYGSVPTILSTQPHQGAGSRWWYRVTRGVLAHEVKHIASYAERISRNGVAEEEWLEESTARLAEEMLARVIFEFNWKGNTTFAQSIFCEIEVSAPGCTDKPYGMIEAFAGLSAYLVENETRTPLGKINDQDATFYGSGWGFVRWAIDHYASDEATFLRALTQEPGLRGAANLSARTGRPFAEMLADYTMALAMDDRAGFTPARPQIRMPSWNLRDMFTELNGSQPQIFPRPYPLVPRAVAFGSFDVSVPSLRAGTASFFELAGAPTGPQLIELASAAGGVPPATLRLHIVRIQ